jgi:hypothetical protein
MRESHGPTLCRQLIVLALCAAANGAALGFGIEGHRVVAGIANRYLDPTAARAVAELLQNDRDATGAPSGRRSLPEVGSWADEVRLTAIGRSTATWHYDNIPVCGSTSPAQFCSAGNCASARLDQMLAVLRDRNAPDEARNEALKWTVHLVADIHQPLHVADHRDRGGNGVAVSYFGETRAPAGRLNLHAIWDVHLVQGMLGESGGESAFVAQEISAAERSDWSSGTIADWIAQSHALAATVVYAKLPVGFACERPISDTVYIGMDYYRSATAILPLQLRRAGVRLAKLLNEALGACRK